MNDSTVSISNLSKTVDKALEMLQDYAYAQNYNQSNTPLHSLLAQCEQILLETPPPEPIRTIHHFACTGGTLISKCIAALPNTVLFSEVDPLSNYYKKVNKSTFSPTDTIFHARNSIREIDAETISGMFLANIDHLHSKLKNSGRRLVLRDHTHSHYCSFMSPHDRPTFKSMMEGSFSLRSCVTVRHPLDAFLSLTTNKWEHFSPFTLEEYCRRHLLFLDDYEGTEIVRYEEFVLSPETTLSHICNILDLTYTPEVFDLLEIIAISGDSGRKSDNIGPRPRRPVPDTLRSEAKNNPTYTALCSRLGYNADVDATAI